MDLAVELVCSSERARLSSGALEREVDAWNDAALAKFLATIESHRWEGPFRLAVMYGLRRSELLGLGWSSVDLKKGTVRIGRRAQPAAESC